VAKAVLSDTATMSLSTLEKLCKTFETICFVHVYTKFFTYCLFNKLANVIIQLVIQLLSFGDKEFFRQNCYAPPGMK